MNTNYGFRYNIVKIRDTGEKKRYIAILHWIGGVRFEEFESEADCNSFLVKSTETLVAEFEVIR